MIGQGDRTAVFEREFSRWVGVEHDGVGVASGAAALTLALLAIGAGRGDEVILPTYVCPSVMEAVITVEATPVLCDVGLSWVMESQNVAPYITNKTKAIIVPHMYGIFADVISFKQFKIPIIEDCAQAITGNNEKQVFGDIAFFSFHPTKCLTTGEGGIAISRNEQYVKRMRILRDGVESANVARVFSPMSDIASSLGLSQLSRYNEALDRRRSIASYYREVLEKVVPHAFSASIFKKSMFFRFPLRVPGGLELYQARFEEKGINIRRGVDKLLHRLLNIADDKYPTSVMLFNSTISLPIYPALTEEEISYCANLAADILSNADTEL